MQQRILSRCKWSGVLALLTLIAFTMLHPLAFPFDDGTREIITVPRGSERVGVLEVERRWSWLGRFAPSVATLYQLQRNTTGKEVDRIPKELRWGMLASNEPIKRNPREYWRHASYAAGWPARSTWCEMSLNEGIAGVNIEGGCALNADERFDPKGLTFLQIQVVPGRIIWRGTLINFAAYAISLFIVFSFWSAIRRFIRARTGRCKECAYPTEGLERCPECGSSSS
ncbi:MAG: hypothetical protein KDD55_05010 [Bdellovibrionales bacterium]|nr:hypothetical protein [Bdellovibrionales bacterium]